MADGSKDVGTMGCTPLYAISVVNTPFASFVVDIEVCQVVVKVY